PHSRRRRYGDQLDPRQAQPVSRLPADPALRPSTKSLYFHDVPRRRPPIAVSAKLRGNSFHGAITETAPRMLDHELQHECGIFGIANHPDAADITYYGLYALQHRGQESAGIAATIDDRIKTYTGMGLVGDIFKAPYFEAFQ